MVHGYSSCTLPILRQFWRRTWPFLTPRCVGAMFGLSIIWRQLCGVIEKLSFLLRWLFCFWMVSTGFLIKWEISVASHGARIEIRLTSSPSSSAAKGCPPARHLGLQQFSSSNVVTGCLPAWCTDLCSAHYIPMAMGCIQHQHWSRVVEPIA